MSKLDAISALGAKPLSGSNQAGQECYELPEYIALHTEIQKLSRVGQSSSVNWTTIIENSVTLLTNHTKDIQIASYLSYSLFRQYRFQGLAVGLKFLVDFIRNFWDVAYPQGREKVKIEFLNWYAAQSINYLMQIQLIKEDGEFQKSILNSIKKLENELLAHGANIDFFSSLRKKIELIEAFSNLPEPEKTEEKQSAKLNETTQYPSKESKINLESALLILTQSARELMGKEPSNAYSYYLNRIAAWSGIEEAPLSEDGVTLVKSPEYFNHERIKKAQEAGYPTELAAIAEEMIPQEPFWLDLHFISLNALRKLDGSFNPVIEMIKREFVNFLARFPSIEQLKFSDGVPFLSEQYKEQFATFSKEKLPNLASHITALSAIEQKQLKQMKEVLTEKNQRGDLASLELLNKNSISGKVKLLSYMAICDSLLNRNEQVVLKPNLTFIIELVERHQLITWEPSLALEALILVYRCMKFLKNNIPPHQMEHVFSLITQIDMKTAIELSQLQ
ncbi:TssA family type VI secretion system protein [Legionella maioricensis]|uniref:TssA family type VI secretion system protein n=2 Tax=Legionella maioricensis TaxID=2896528 RepID=A0A9X2ICX0_9GAMM|nr:TssA family type VI secretion system protein [Legionella maioricensis]MCL9684922.1 TssA family type VI secretion system protein [Legionella maioricensis]MCL9688246.1 TssA family type VI secretion system protein [Legionella maioricensis]